jgi:ATP-dependent RNA helicase SUPV3L1/SUV3
MMSLVGCSGEEFSNLLKGLGYQPRLEKVKPPKPIEKPVEAPKFIVETISGETLSTPAEASAPVEETPSEMPAVATEPSEAEPAVETAVETADAAPVVEAEAELVEMEIWRPARRHKPAPRERHARRGAAAPAEGAAASATDGAPGEAKRERHRRPRRHRGAPAQQVRVLVAGLDARGDRANDNRNKDNREKRGKDQRGDRNKDNRHKGGGKDRDKDRGGRGERREWSSAPPRREREVDPDSPFAALAVLKERVRGN